MCCFLGGGVSAYSSSSFPTVTEAPHVEVLCLARSNSLEASLAELQSNINQMGRQMGLKLLALHLKSHTLVTPIWSYSKERSSSINDGYDNIYRLQRSHVLQLRSQCKESDAPAGVHSFSASPLAST
ncbi:uncharacterized protein LOC119307323 isoform X2 [Triticum dicoccoides]|uniref:uncharacterized protein LOC119307323 isoform X2 n=1 Tax=Triticum dicoccoides TaxID=85692 RepID=UPI0018902169|nr:uncharacterized protein LOC119307323 isoform X2 [Triticum dicoccoides]